MDESIERTGRGVVACATEKDSTATVGGACDLDMTVGDGSKGAVGAAAIFSLKLVGRSLSKVGKTV